VPKRGDLGNIALINCWQSPMVEGWAMMDFNQPDADSSEEPNRECSHASPRSGPEEAGFRLQLSSDPTPMRREDICENSCYVNSLVKQRNLSSRNSWYLRNQNKASGRPFPCLSTEPTRPSGCRPKLKPQLLSAVECSSLMSSLC
jgi:hypothetical protein